MRAKRARALRVSEGGVVLSKGARRRAKKDFLASRKNDSSTKTTTGAPLPKTTGPWHRRSRAFAMKYLMRQEQEQQREV